MEEMEQSSECARLFTGASLTFVHEVKAPLWLMLTTNGDSTCHSLPETVSRRSGRRDACWSCTSEIVSVVLESASRRRTAQ